MERYRRIFEDSKTSFLKKQFNTFNKKYFNNKLNIKDIIVSGSFFKSAFIGAAYNFYTNEIIFNKNNFPDEVLDVILLHEMIHVYNHQVDRIDHNKEDAHGLKFIKIKNIIDKHLKYKIPTKEDFSSIEYILDDLGIE